MISKLEYRLLDLRKDIEDELKDLVIKNNGEIKIPVDWGYNGKGFDINDIPCEIVFLNDDGAITTYIDEITYTAEVGLSFFSTDLLGENYDLDYISTDNLARLVSLIESL